MAEAESDSLEYTPTWVVALVCLIIVLLSLLAERGLHYLGKYLKHKKQNALFEALQKLKEELMLLGFISLLLTVSQREIIRICIPANLVTQMLPCERKTGSSEAHQAINNRRQLLSTESSAEQCKQGKVPLLSLEALHHLHIFIFVLAVVHMIFCATTMVLGGARIRQWKIWEDSLLLASKNGRIEEIDAEHLKRFKLRADGYWRKSAVISWMVSFFKQFYDSLTKSDYIVLRHGFITTHCSSNFNYNFYNYVMRILEEDFRKIVGISWYLWLFVVNFLLLNMKGWHTYFWLAFLPLILLLLVGAKLEHIITRMAQEAALEEKHDEAAQLKLSDKHFWFHKPAIILHLIHFILFQNAFEIAFFFWIWSTYGFHSCMMERIGYIITRLFMGVVVQVLCSYSTLPLYAIVTPMSSKFKSIIFASEDTRHGVDDWLGRTKYRGDSPSMHKMTKESSQIAEQEMIVIEGTTTSITELSCVPQMPMPSP